MRLLDGRILIKPHDQDTSQIHTNNIDCILFECIRSSETLNNLNISNGALLVIPYHCCIQIEEGIFCAKTEDVLAVLDSHTELEELKKQTKGKK